MIKSNKIRKITVLDAIPFVDKETRELTGVLLPLNLIVGVDHTIYIENEPRPLKRRICEIEETQKGYNVYLENGTESQLWKKIPKSNKVIVEYVID